MFKFTNNLRITDMASSDERRRSSSTSGSGAAAAPHAGTGFKLIVELSGLWFLGLHNETLTAVAAGTRHLEGSLAHPMHHPRLFVHSEHGPQGGKPDKDDPNYRQFEITSSIAWQSEVKSIAVTDLPPNITNLQKHTGHKFNPGHLKTSICVPLIFPELIEVFPRYGFTYTDDGRNNCGWGTNVPLAWKLIYLTDVLADRLSMTFPDGSSQTLIPRDEDGTVTLKIKNTTEKHSHARDPLESEDDGTDAKHFAMHYGFLEKRPSAECYPVRMKSSLEGESVSGLYTCMFGGGGS
jgi:hypothetical protein